VAIRPHAARKLQLYPGGICIIILVSKLYQNRSSLLKKEKKLSQIASASKNLSVSEELPKS
jgi:hypothetical protein